MGTPERLPMHPDQLLLLTVAARAVSRFGRALHQNGQPEPTRDQVDAITRAFRPRLEALMADRPLSDDDLEIAALKIVVDAGAEVLGLTVVDADAAAKA